MHEMEVQARLMEEKEARIHQAQRHAEDLRRTRWTGCLRSWSR